jgi:hypothetical protein
MGSAGGDGRERYILITQCLQNDLFFTAECRLALPQRIVTQMLLPPLEASEAAEAGRAIAPARLRRGPLGGFLEATVGEALAGKRSSGLLHVVNIRDWHTPGPVYDLERRSYGPHCEPGTRGAAYLDGLERYLDPGRAAPSTVSAATFYQKEQARIYHIHSESVFDFKPQSGQVPEGGHSTSKHPASQLEQILDVLIQGNEEDVGRLGGVLAPAVRWEQLRELADEITDRAEEGPLVYIGVIGVYTDIKILTLLAGLRTRYDIQNLAVSDSLTASATLERHLNGLDFASKVLGVDVVHGLNELARYVGATAQIPNEGELVSRQPYARYETFFQDKQNVLAYQDEKLNQYLALTERRAVDLYERIKRANQFLIWFGSAFLILTLVGAVLSAIFPDRFDWRLPLVTGGVSLLQLIGAFYTKPIHDLQQNLTNLATFKMILESHSLKMALARFHLTTPEALREIQLSTEADEAALQVDVLRREVDAIQSYDRSDFESLAKLAFAQAAGTDGASDGDSSKATPRGKEAAEEKAPADTGAPAADVKR